VKLSRAEFDARGRAREGCHAQWICHARAELLKRPSGEVAAGPSHPRFRRPRPHPFDDRNQLAPGALGTQPAAHFPLPRARSVTQGVVENGYALVFSAPFHTHPSADRANVDKSWHVSDHRRRTKRYASHPWHLGTPSCQSLTWPMPKHRP
jgi:hypothetical protein